MIIFIILCAQMDNKPRNKTQSCCISYLVQFSSITVIFKDKSMIIYTFFEQLKREPIAYEMCIAFMSLCLPAPWNTSCSMANQEQLSVILAGEKS